MDILLYNRDYEVAYKKLDIVEVREDGYFNTHGWDHSAFLLVQIPGEPVNQTLHNAEMEEYTAPNGDKNHRLKTKRKYKFDIIGQDKINLETNKSIILSRESFNNYLKVKS